MHGKKHDLDNQSRGLVFIGDFHIYNTGSLEQVQQAKYDSKEMLHAHWIPVKNANTKPCVTIPRQGTIDVREYGQEPLLCTNCHGYTLS